MRPRRFAAGAAAAILALAVAYAGLRWGALVAGGSDSYGYISQAELWRRGSLVVRQDVVRPTPWPFAADTWTPLGYRPSPHIRDGYVPVYAPGLPLLMAAAQSIAGFCAAFAIVPLCGALTVWLTYRLGRRVFEPIHVALIGAILVAASPVFLYQVMNAMSDVPVTAFWTLALVLAVDRRPFASGIAMAIATAIRPNLAPLASIVVVWLWITDADAAMRRRSLIRFAIGFAPAIVGIAWLNATLYESAFTSGYGTTADLYSPRYFGDNVRNYLSWMADVETPIVALGVLFVAAPRLGATRLPFARLLIGATIAAMLLSYVFYQPFDVWWYLRFLLPMWPVLMLATAAAIDAIVARLLPRRAPAHAVVMAAIVALLTAHHLRLAAERSAFNLGRLERRYVDVARYIADHTEPRAVVLSHQHSGSLRLYADRLTLRYDILDPAWLDRSLALLESAGRRPYLVLDGREVEQFRKRFAGSVAGALDQAPIATLNGVVFVYDPLNRQPGGSLAIGATRRSRSLLACDTPYNLPPVRRMK